MGSQADRIQFTTRHTNLNYSELNFIAEAWLRVFTSNEGEAVENPAQGKDIEDYRRLIEACFVEAFRVLKPGRWITIEDRRTLLRRDGEPAEVIGIVRDVTAEATAAAQAREELAAERRVAEELRRLDEMRTAFLSAVSHELRTPLTGVVGFAEEFPIWKIACN